MTSLGFVEDSSPLIFTSTSARSNSEKNLKNILLHESPDKNPTPSAMPLLDLEDEELKKEKDIKDRSARNSKVFRSLSLYSRSKGQVKKVEGGGGGDSPPTTPRAQISTPEVTHSHHAPPSLLSLQIQIPVPDDSIQACNSAPILSARLTRSRTSSTINTTGSPRGFSLSSMTNKILGGLGSNGKEVVVLSKEVALEDSSWLERSPAMCNMHQWDTLKRDSGPGDLVDSKKLKNFRFEFGSKIPQEPLFIEDFDRDLLLYQTHFAGTDHTNYLSEDEQNPAIISLESPKSKEQKYFKALVRTKEKEERFVVIGGSNKDRLKHLVKEAPYLNVHKLFKCPSPTLERELTVLEQQLKFNEYKFGVLYAKENQTEDQMFANQHSDTVPEFEDFLKFLGEKVTLLGWNKYRGGLDNKKNTTGIHSIFTSHFGYDIMFHVSTYLPYFPNDKQQVERKRHLGNDVVVIIFYVGTSPFSCDLLTSHFNQVYLIIQPFHAEDKSVRYKLVSLHDHFFFSTIF
eukprot:TRINITY_DN4323_c0_g1_i1.p1 TRINITY_DN4323_c0_g1~~TRINITY_DN4323_c0_g1_i1.p1  ORF type:complete len:514 (+),score=109.33 TRINITY_DN4323_c0_g1_i1:171-1712(+)